MIVAKIILGIVVAIYVVSLLFILIYSLTQAYLTATYLLLRQKKWHPGNNPSPSPPPPPLALPPVTVQLPLYNEQYVVERLLDAIACLDYPAPLLQIQVLDDSTDQTVSLAAARIAHYQARGLNFQHLTRTVRTGYKAGALREALPAATGEYIAIFDADFIPEPDFLIRTLAAFTTPDTGMVQTRWTHLNREDSLLTRAQAFAIDAHFHIEQTGRNLAHCFINFNGTAGMWRKACILDAGNWQDDTLTEDLDLSYRAQLRGWQFQYLEHTTSPAELPPVMSAIKSQQYRWNKGGAETALKLWRPIVNSNFGFRVKWHGLWHLFSSSVFIAVFFSAFCSVPLLYFKEVFPALVPYYSWLSVFMLSFVFVAAIYYVVCAQQHKGAGRVFVKYVKEFPVFLAVSMGMSLHNAVAVTEGYAGRKTPFIRTPKFSKNLSQNQYREHKITPLAIVEALLVLYFGFGIYFAISHHQYSLLPFHLLLTCGFGIVAWFSLIPPRSGKG